MRDNCDREIAGAERLPHIVLDLRTKRKRVGYRDSAVRLAGQQHRSRPNGIAGVVSRVPDPPILIEIERIRVYCMQEPIAGKAHQASNAWNPQRPHRSIVGGLNDCRLAHAVRLKGNGAQAKTVVTAAAAW